jgi:hypothetical protein
MVFIDLLIPSQHSGDSIISDKPNKVLPYSNRHRTAAVYKPPPVQGNPLNEIVIMRVLTKAFSSSRKDKLVKDICFRQTQLWIESQLGCEK